MANGSGTSYAGGASVSNLSSTADAVVTLYAQWSLIDYSITYHVNGGTGIGNNPTQYNVESQIILSGITREHYTFAGWFSDEGLTVAVTSIAPGTIGDIDLYAKWTEILYVVSLDLSGGRFTQSPEGWTSNNGVMLRSYLSGTSIATIVSSLGSPVKDPSTTLSYMFDSWDVISGNLFGDLKITASYKASFIIPEPSEGTTSVDSSEVQVATLSSESITSLKESVDNGKLNDVEIILKEGALSLDSESIRSLTGTNLEVSIKKDVEIPETVKGAAEGRSVYEIRIGDVHEFGGKLKITLDYKLQNDEDPDKLVIWNIKDDGTHEVMQCDYSNGKISFSTTHLSYYAVMVDDSSEPQSFPWVWIVVGAVLLVAAAGVAFFVIKKKA